MMLVSCASMMLLLLLLVMMMMTTVSTGGTTSTVTPSRRYVYSLGGMCHFGCIREMLMTAEMFSHFEGSRSDQLFVDRVSRAPS